MNERRDALFPNENLPFRTARRFPLGKLSLRKETKKKKTEECLAKHGILNTLGPRGARSYAAFKFPRFSLVFQVQRSVTSLMTLLSTQYKTPRHPSLQIKPIHRILIPRVILSEPTPPPVSRVRIVSNLFAMSQLWVSLRDSRFPSSYYLFEPFECCKRDAE